MYSFRNSSIVEILGNSIKLFTNIIDKLPKIYLLTYPKVDQLEFSSLGVAPAFLTNIRLGLKGLPGTNTLAY
jgi:hypothetical protein